MAPTPAKFPRRYAQRQALRIRSTASSSDLRSQDLRRRHITQARRKHRASIDQGDDSTRESDSDIDIDREDEKDSGYASNSDVEAEYLNGLVEKFRDMGPQISNLGDVALEMIEKEKNMWQK
jgi:hypothetical protein